MVNEDLAVKEFHGRLRGMSLPAIRHFISQASDEDHWNKALETRTKDETLPEALRRVSDG